MPAPTNFSLPVAGSAPNQYATEDGLEGAVQAFGDRIFDTLNDGKADLSRSVSYYPSRDAAVAAGQDVLRATIGTVVTREGNELVYRGAAAFSDDPLFETAPRWGVLTRVFDQSPIAAAFRDAGAIRLMSVAGTVNDITARMVASFENVKVQLGQYSSVQLVPIGNNTASEVYLTVLGDSRRQILRQNGTPLQPGDLRFGRVYTLSRSGDNYRISGGDIARSDLGSAAFRESPDLLDRATMTQGSVIALNVTGSGNAMQAVIHPNLPQVGITSAGILRFVAPGTNTAPNPQITLDGVTRTIYDADGSPLNPGAIRFQRMYLIRVQSLTTARLVTGPGFSDIPTSASFTDIWSAIGEKASITSVSSLGREVEAKAPQAQVDGLIARVDGLTAGTRIVGDWIGSGAYPATRPGGGSIQSGDQFNVTGTGTVDGITWANGDILTALVNGGGATYSGNWSRRSGTATAAAQVSTAKPGRSVQDALDLAPLWSIWDFYLPTDTGIQQAINRAITAAHAAGGGGVVFERRADVHEATAAIVLRSDVDLINIGQNVVRLAGGVDANVIESVGYATAAAGGFLDRSLAIEDFNIFGRIVTDGNREGNLAAGQHSGKGFAIYGRSFSLEDIAAWNSRNEGIVTEYVAAGAHGISPYGGKIERLEAKNSGKQGWLNGVSDLMYGMANILNSSLNADAEYSAFLSTRGTRGSSMTVWRGGSVPATHKYAVEQLSGGLMAPVLSLETGKEGQVFLGDGGDIQCNSYNMIGSGKAHFTLGGSLATIRGRITQGGLGAADSIAVHVPAGATVRGCKVDLTTSGEFAHMLKVDGTSVGANEFTFRASFAAGDWEPVVGALHATDEVKFTQSGGNERSLHKKATGAVVATGTTQASARGSSGAVLKHQINRVSSEDAANIAVILPSSLIGVELRVANTSARAITIFPQLGAAFYGLAVNQGYSLAAFKSASLVCESASLWSVVG